MGSAPDARHPRGAGLLLFDLDDTLIQSGSYVSERVLRALVSARDAGATLSIASGRPLCSVQRQILESGAMDYAVCSNGATVTRLSDGAVIASHLLKREDAIDCYEMLRDLRPAWNAFCDGKAYFELLGASYMLTGRTGAVARTMRSQGGRGNLARRMARLLRRGLRYVWRSLANPNHRQVLSMGAHLRRGTGGIEKMGCTIRDPEACARAAEALRADGRFEVVLMGRTELEITARGVSKGTGARLLMEHLGTDPARAVAFGDGGNDLPLAAAVGRFVAMGNADDEVKAAATEVCPAVGDDGVAVWIEGNLLA